MADKAIEDYSIEQTELPLDDYLYDQSTEVSPAVYRSDKVKYGILKGINKLASGTVDFNTAAVTGLTNNFSGKSVTPTMIRIKNTAFGKGLSGVAVRINKNAGVGDIMPLETMVSFGADQTYILYLMGALPEDLIDTDTFNFEIVDVAGNPNTCDVEIYGTHEDV